MKLILHMGTEKTGSTALQNFLYKNETVLREKGYALFHCLGSPNNDKLYAYAIHLDGKYDTYFSRLGILDNEKRATYFENLVADMANEISKNHHLGVHTMLISSEHLQSRIRSREQLEILYSTLNGLFSHIQIVCYFREQGRLVESLYSTAIKSGWDISSREFTEVFLEDDHFILYDELVAMWKSVFTSSEFCFRIFDKKYLIGQDVRSDFISAVMLIEEGSIFDYTASLGDNYKLGRSGVFILRLLNKFFPRIREDKTYSKFSELVSRVLERIPLFLYLGDVKFKCLHLVRSKCEASNIRFGRICLGINKSPFDT